MRRRARPPRPPRPRGRARPRGPTLARTRRAAKPSTSSSSTPLPAPTPTPRGRSCPRGCGTCTRACVEIKPRTPHLAHWLISTQVRTARLRNRGRPAAAAARVDARAGGRLEDVARLRAPAARHLLGVRVEEADLRDAAADGDEGRHHAVFHEDLGEEGLAQARGEGPGPQKGGTLANFLKPRISIVFDLPHFRTSDHLSGRTQCVDAIFGNCFENTDVEVTLNPPLAARRRTRRTRGTRGSLDPSGPRASPPSRSRARRAPCAAPGSAPVNASSRGRRCCRRRTCRGRTR